MTPASLQERGTIRYAYEAGFYGADASVMSKLAAMDRTSLGIDVGAETIKVVTVSGGDGTCRIREQRSEPHNKEPHATLQALLADMDLSDVRGVAVTGRLRRVVAAEPVPSKAALRKGVRVVHPELARATVVSVGAHGFAVLTTERRRLQTGGRVEAG